MGALGHAPCDRLALFAGAWWLRSMRVRWARPPRPRWLNPGRVWGFQCALQACGGVGCLEACLLHRTVSVSRLPGSDRLENEMSLPTCSGLLIAPVPSAGI